MWKCRSYLNKWKGVDNIGAYRAFLINSKAGYILTSFKSYAELKKYNSDFGDMVPMLATNTLGIKIVSVGIPESSSKTRIFYPTNLNKNTRTVYIVKNGDHYDGIVSMSSQFRKYSDIILGTDDSCSKGLLDASNSSRSPLYYNRRSSDKKNGSYLASHPYSKNKLLKQNGYRLFHVNTCSLLPKIPELRALAEKYYIHLMSINETHLDETVNDFELEIPGFVIYRNDRNRHGGGVALYVRDDVKHKPRKDLTIPGLESVWIEKSTPDNKDDLVWSMYRPPSASAAYYDKIIDNLELASSKNMEIIVFGRPKF